MRNSVLALALTALFLGAPASARAQQKEPRIADERIVFRTDMGDLVLLLYPDVAPNHVQQILTLVRIGAYDGIRFHRIDPSFVVQCTSAQDRLVPLTQQQSMAIHKLAPEFSGLKHDHGTLSMARGEALDSAESSFSVVLVPSPHLDGKYTIFGRLDPRSEEVLEAMTKVECDAGHAPRVRLGVQKAFVVDSAAALAQVQLHGPPAVTPQAAERHVPAAGALAFVVIAMMLMGGATFVFIGRLSARTVGAFGLATILLGGFYLLVALGPEGRMQPMLAGAVFVGLLGMFKLMGRFESTLTPPGGKPPG